MCLIVVALLRTHVVQLFDTILFEVVFKCNSLRIYVCKFHVNNILGALGAQMLGWRSNSQNKYGATI